MDDIGNKELKTHSHNTLFSKVCVNWEWESVLLNIALHFHIVNYHNKGSNSHYLFLPSLSLPLALTSYSPSLIPLPHFCLFSLSPLSSLDPIFESPRIDEDLRARVKATFPEFILPCMFVVVCMCVFTCVCVYMYVCLRVYMYVCIII